MPLTEGDVRIHWQVHGPADGEPVVLIGGGATQLIDWRDEFVALLVGRGLRVVRFDHRDTGLSQRFGDGPDAVDGGYSVQEAAIDVLRVLDALDLDAAHLVGHSMGGIMAQYLALDHPSRVRSMVLVSTIPGLDPAYLVGPQLAAADLVPWPALPRAEALAQFVETQRTLHAASTGFSFDEDDERTHAARQLDRGYEPNAFQRHWSALLRADDRLARLAAVTVPTAVVHGTEDATLRPLAAEQLAAAVPGAELLLIDGMGHRLERALWPVYEEVVVRTVGRAAATGARGAARAAGSARAAGTARAAGSARA